MAKEIQTTKTLTLTTCKIILGKNSKALTKHTAQLTVATALEGDQLSRLSRENESELETIISAIVMNFNNSINVGNKLTKDQVYEISLAIISEYWMFKIDEVLNCFKMAKGGKFGEIKRLDQPTVMGFLHMYDTKTKADYFNSRTTAPQRREREEDIKPTHINLSIEQIEGMAPMKINKKTDKI